MELNSAKANEAESGTDFEPVESSVRLIREALRIVDAQGWPPEIGARHVICSIEGLD